MHSHTPSPGRPVDHARRRSPFPHVRLAVAALLLAALAACGSSEPPDPDPPGPSDGTSLVVAPNDMNGVTAATVQVVAPGAWRLQVVSDGGFAGRVRLSRASGTGSAVTTLTVDPEGLDPRQRYAFQLRLEAGGDVRTAAVEFSFPDVRGQVLLGGPGAAALGPAALAPEGELHPLAAAPALYPASVDLAPLTSAAGTVTLLVGLEAADRGLAAARLPGEPSATALSSLAATVDGLAGAALQGGFEAAGLAFVEVPAAEVAAAAARLSAAAGVRYVELPVPLYPYSFDEFRGLQWNLDVVGAERLWPVTRGEGVTIAVLDNGFYPDHEDLAANVVGQYDAGDGKSSVRATRAACGTHGTHVAGIAAAVADNGIGVAGAAPGAGLLLVDLDYETRPGCPMDSASLIRGLDYVVNGGAPRAQVVNMSIGTPSDLGRATRDALVAAQRAGLVLVGAAGNTQCSGGRDTFVPVSYPAAYPEVWAIGATDPGNGRACYSHVGGELRFVAPGGDSSYDSGRFDAVYSTDHDPVAGQDTYGWMEGTSMAAPLVSGVVALLWSAVPSATPEELLQALIAGAVDLGDPGRDNLFGYGLVDAPAAFEALTGGSEPPPPPPPPPPSRVVRITVPGYGTHVLDPDGAFTLIDAPLGPLTVVAESDDDGDGVFAEPGEGRGSATVDVEFDADNRVYVELKVQ